MGTSSGEVVRRWSVSVLRGELGFELVDEDLWIKNTPEFPIPGPFHGHDGLRAWWRELTEVFSDSHIELDELTVLDAERVLTTQRLVGTFAATGIPVDAPWASIFTVREGKITRIEGFATRSAALRAHGLAGDTHGQAG